MKPSTHGAAAPRSRSVSTSGPIATAWNVHGWPTIYVLDHEGKIRVKNQRGDELEKAIDELVAEAKKAPSKGTKKSAGK